MPRLLRTMATYGCVWTASDITQELVISRKDHVDWSKTARIATTGALVMAPLLHTWIQMVEVMFPGSSVRMILKKVLMEQTCFSPVAISSFYLTTSALEGKSGLPELEAKFKQTYLTGLTFWPFVQMFNFRFVPHRRKAQFIACASFVWTIFLCFMKEENGFLARQEDIIPSCLKRGTKQRLLTDSQPRFTAVTTQSIAFSLFMRMIHTGSCHHLSSVFIAAVVDRSSI